MDQHTIDIEKTEALADEAACIFRVHEGLRRENKRAYTPKLISIGPYHHGQPKLFAMEKLKERYLELLLQHSNQSLEPYLDCMKKLEERARKYYADPVDHLNSKKFVKMMLYDACFVTRFLLGVVEFYAGKDKHQQSQVGDEVKVSWKRIQIYNDLMLLENQLPFFVISEFYDMAYDVGVTFPMLALLPILQNLPREIDISKINFENMSVFKSKHFLDLVHNVCLPSSSRDESNNHQNKNQTTCFKIPCNVCLPSSSKEESNNHQNKNQTTCFKMPCNVFLSSSSRDESNNHQNKNQTTCFKMPCNVFHSSSFRDESNNHQNKNQTTCFKMPCVIELQDAGVKFEAIKHDNDGHNLNMLDIRFEHGRFKIPKFKVTDSTETFFRNIIAYEQQSSDDEPKYFTDYTYFMDQLINYKEDVSELRRHEVLENWLGDDEKVALMFNNLGNGRIISEQFYYAEQCSKVNAHCKRWWNKRVASLKRDYFKNIWVTVATFAAAFLLLITLTQTVIALITILTSSPSRH